MSAGSPESWNARTALGAITDFVDAVTDGDAPTFVEPADRIAVFDHDGTLWSERPIPVQMDFVLAQLRARVADDASLAHQQPYSAAVAGDYGWLNDAMVAHYRGHDRDMNLLVAAASQGYRGTSVEDFADQVRTWFTSASHPLLARPYRRCAFAPMVELLRYLEANGFATFIVSGGERDFMRPFAEELYGLPPERVIGSSVHLVLDEGEHELELRYGTGVEFIDDGQGKPVRIWSRIGRRPLIAVGNSNGDIPMLSFAGTTDRPGLRILIDHDDDVREFAYTDGAELALERARASGWTVVSMRDDWSRVFDDAS
jgi:phosphoserine phosphatase